MQEKTRLPQAADTGNSPVEVSVYDPAMCCPTGVCGPGIDPELMEISRDLQWLESQGVGVERFNLAQEPDAFVGNRRVSGLMQAFGDGALPAVLLNGEVHCHGRYPSREELVEAVKGAKGSGGSGVAPEAPDAPAATGEATGGSCCGPNSGCC